MLADGRLGVLDFGAVARSAVACRSSSAGCCARCWTATPMAVHRLLSRTGFIETGNGIPPAAALDYLVPTVRPLEDDDSSSAARGCGRRWRG